MIKEQIPELEKLTKAEKVRLAGELWSEAFEEKDVLLSDEQKKELKRRIEYAKEHPEEMKSWEEVRDNLKEKYDI